MKGKKWGLVLLICMLFMLPTVVLAGSQGQDTKRTLKEAETSMSVQESAAADDAEYDFQEDVIEVPKEEEVSISGDGTETEVTIQDSDVEIEEGDTFVVYQDSLPIAYKAEKVEAQDGDSVIQVSRAGDDAYGELGDQQGTLRLNASNTEFIPAENVNVITDTFSAGTVDTGNTRLEYKDGQIVLSTSLNGSSVKMGL
ncbi:hypothetical protein, partial [Blautia sp. MSJ-19]|uniref:hypothetical protein n=1 Tax=Blautia sp. MSJ-19 TaxID=2841517 RepID=UPI001C0EFC18